MCKFWLGFMVVLTMVAPASAKGPVDSNKQESAKDARLVARSFALGEAMASAVRIMVADPKNQAILLKDMDFKKLETELAGKAAAIYTPAELRALGRMLADPAGKSALTKQPQWQSAMYNVVAAEFQRVFIAHQELFPNPPSNLGKPVSPR